MNILLGNDEIRVVTSCKHVGVALASKSVDVFNAYQDRVAGGRKIVYSARGIGSERVPVSPLVMSKLYWSAVIPKITYGLEVTPLTEQGIQLMERSHRQTCLLIQGLPQSTPTPAPLATVGWLSMVAFVAMKKILFLFRILCLPDHSIYKRVALYILGECRSNINISKIPTSSPIADMYKMACNCGLQGRLRTCVINNEFGCFNAHKLIIKRIV